MVPWSNRPQPSTAPFASASVRPSPDGAFLTRALACESPTTTTLRGRWGGRVPVTGAPGLPPAETVDGAAPAAATGASGESATLAGWKTSSEPPVVTSTGSAVATRAPTKATESNAAVAPTAAHPRARDRSSAVGAPVGDPLHRRPVAHRPLDEPEAELGQRERQPQPQREAGPAVHARVVLLAGHHEDRPVPQVEPVAARAQPAQRRQRERGPEGGGARVDGDGHHHDRQHGDQQEAPAVEHARRLAPLEHDGDEREQRQPADRVEAGQPAPSGPRPPPRRPDHRRSRADEQTRRAGVGAEVAREASPAGSKTIAIHAVDARAATTIGTTRRSVRPRTSPMASTNTSGHRRYHCSSTARDHR